MFMGVLPLREWKKGPSCKELGVFNKYNCFTFDLHVSRLILESEGKKYDKTDPRPSSPVGNFCHPETNSYGNLGPRFQVSEPLSPS